MPSVDLKHPSQLNKELLDLSKKRELRQESFIRTMAKDMAGLREPYKPSPAVLPKIPQQAPDFSKKAAPPEKLPVAGLSQEREAIQKKQEQEQERLEVRTKAMEKARDLAEQEKKAQEKAQKHAEQRAEKIAKEKKRAEEKAQKQAEEQRRKEQEKARKKAEQAQNKAEDARKKAEKQAQKRIKQEKQTQAKLAKQLAKQKKDKIKTVQSRPARPIKPVIISIIVILVLGGIGGFVYWLNYLRPVSPVPLTAEHYECADSWCVKVKGEGDDQCQNDDDCAITEPVEPVVPDSLIPVSQTQPLELVIGQEPLLKEKLKLAGQQLQTQNTFKRILVKLVSQTEKKYADLEFLLTSLGTGLPSNVLSAIALEQAEAGNYTLFFYSQEQGNRLGIVIDMGQSQTLVQDLKNWEQTIITDLEPFFLKDQTPAPGAIQFQDNLYQGTSIRYLNFPNPDLSIDYALLSGKLLIATSRDSMYALINILSAE